MTVGTLGNTYYSSGIKDNKDYDSILTVTFEDTTDADYTALLEHYQTTSTGTDDNGSLLFDWGYLQMTSDNGTIQITAYIKWAKLDMEEMMKNYYGSLCTEIYEILHKDAP